MPRQFTGKLADSAPRVSDEQARAAVLATLKLGEPDNTGTRDALDALGLTKTALEMQAEIHARRNRRT